MPSSEQTSVHPRWRGEQFSSASAPLGKAGSSPLARGTGYRQFAGHVTFRFIPAGAGNRHIIFLDTCWASVHPRWRGEQGGLGRNIARQVGSSPLARGTDGLLEYANEKGPVHPRWRGEQLPWMPPLEECLRFIPAGAGNSHRPGQRSGAAPVHPRWRGEQGFPGRPAQFHAGSSPLARGTA